MSFQLHLDSPVSLSLLHSGLLILLLKIVVMHAYNRSTQEVEIGGSLQVQGQPGLQSELKTSLNYIVKLYHKKT